MKASTNEAYDVEFSEPVWEWQKEAGEAAGDYAAFLAFASLRPADRTPRNAWRVWTKDTDKEGSSVNTLYTRTMEEWHWAERAAARDIHLLRQRYVDWAERDWEWREKDYAMGARIRGKIEKVLDQLDDDKIELSVTEAAQLAKVASDLQSKAVPQVFNLSALQVQEALMLLPDEKRAEVIKLMTQKATPRLTMHAVSSDENIVEGEYSTVSNETD